MITTADCTLCLHFNVYTVEQMKNLCFGFVILTPQTIKRDLSLIIQYTIHKCLKRTVTIRVKRTSVPIERLSETDANRCGSSAGRFGWLLFLCSSERKRRTTRQPPCAVLCSQRERGCHWSERWLRPIHRCRCNHLALVVVHGMRVVERRCSACLWHL